MFAKAFLTILTAAAVLGSAPSTQAALAANNSSVVSKIVFIGDLNLSNQTGARIALQRIQVAATVVCGGATELRLLDSAARYRACTRAAVDRAVASLDSPVMAALHSPQGMDVLASDR